MDENMTADFASQTVSRRRLLGATAGVRVALSALAAISRPAAAADEHAGHGTTTSRTMTRYVISQ